MVLRLESITFCILLVFRYSKDINSVVAELLPFEYLKTSKIIGFSPRAITPQCLH